MVEAAPLVTALALALALVLALALALALVLVRVQQLVVWVPALKRKPGLVLRLQARQVRQVRAG